MKNFIKCALICMPFLFCTHTSHAQIFGPDSTIASGEYPAAIYTVDLDGDGDIDLLSSSF